mmetsp:Transcript_4775/g.13054  ORF Transcript_4775/g.13054 Transcript_4775/m.13054 type:complete len:238 (+) Transcript_4775:111-824(+)
MRQRSSMEGSAARSKRPRPSLWRPMTSPLLPSMTTQRTASAHSSSSDVTSNRNCRWICATVTHSGSLRSGKRLPTSGRSSTLSCTTSPSSIASMTSTFGRTVSPSAAHIAKLTESSKLPPDVSTSTSTCTSQAKTPGTTHSAFRSMTSSLAQSASSSTDSCLLASSAPPTRDPPSEKATETDAAQSTLMCNWPASGRRRLGLAISHLTLTSKSVSPARNRQDPVLVGMGPISNAIRL